MKKAIIIMAKVPEAGAVKTRLQPFLTGEECRELSVCFLKDVEAKVKEVNFPTVIAFAPLEKKGELLKILRYEHILIDQVGENLGERMFGAFEYAFKTGCKSVVMIGTDSPTMPKEALTEAFALLDSGLDGVLGESDDGGFYLIGINSLTEDLFSNVDWGTELAFNQIRANLAKHSFNLELVSPWYDVDDPNDLLRLRKELETNSAIAPYTSEWLKKN